MLASTRPQRVIASFVATFRAADAVVVEGECGVEELGDPCKCADSIESINIFPQRCPSHPRDDAHSRWAGH